MKTNLLESSAWFWRDRSTADQIFCVFQILKKKREYNWILSNLLRGFKTTPLPSGEYTTEWSFKSTRVKTVSVIVWTSLSWNYHVVLLSNRMENHWNHGTTATMEPLEPWNHCNHRTLEPREPWNHCNLGTTGTTATMEPLQPLQPLQPWSHETSPCYRMNILIMKLSCGVTKQQDGEPLEPWNHETTATMEPWNHWNHGTMEPLQPWNHWNHCNHCNHGTMEPWNH
jgi:hypothetical protein